MLSHSLVSASVASSLTQGPANPAASAEKEEAKRARDAFDGKRYPEAAARYEDLWASSREARYLFNAAMARELAGHEAHAYFHLQRYLARPTMMAAEQEKGLGRLNDLKQRTVPLRVRSTPGAELTLTLELKPSGAPTDVGRVPVKAEPEISKSVALSDEPGVYVIYVEPGTWTVSAAAPGYPPESGEVLVRSHEKPSLDLFLKAEAPAPMPVTVTFSPPAAVAGGIIVTTEGPGEPAQYTVPPSGELTIPLPAGTRLLRASAPGFESRTLSVSTTGGSQALTMELTPRGVSGARDSRQQFSHGLKIGGGTVLTLGLGLIIIGGAGFQPSYASFDEPCETEGAFCYKPGAHRALRNALWLYDTGAILAGAGAAALAYGVVSGRKPAGKQWKTQLGVGVGLVSLGLVAAIASHAADDGLEDVIYRPTPGLKHGALGGLITANVLGFALIGSGAALIVLSPVEHKLFGKKKNARVHARISPALSLTGAGLNMRVGF
ncbi:carboxypeptidase-like regulatory domain-containing protein [Nannocystis sp. RBIL2]|uniref:carboxypeptidase-like regulatory domain-containing protein n=1 Tax=Nannocystis sp. RBIL2 TaxID=2996788 RepID=UPI0022713184|nr:carboxypeptidase-like regulatory domain-containing protein [Nannocystis sp. RBIL2]MCY1064441.1 carboxypeptidase-like regulatory domain-containing protein [Nannocystis sp. RBIL2]